MKKILLLSMVIMASLWSYSQTVTGTITHLTCFNDNTGAIDITVNNGDGTETYAWSGPNGFSSTAEDISGLAAGTYTVTLQNATGATVDTETFNVTEPPEIGVLLTSTSETCYGANDPSIALTVSEGMPPYTFLRSTGATTQNITGLSGGYNTFYNVTVTDANGCEKMNETSIPETFPLSFDIEVTNSNCGNADGSAEVQVNNAQYPNAAFLWSTGQTGSSISNLAAGIYSVEMTDDPATTNCSQTKYFFIEDNSGAAINPTVVDASSPTNNNGEITLNITGGNSPHTVVWDNAVSGLSNSNLYPGSYSATITDGTDCMNTTCVTVNSLQGLSGSVSPANTSMCSGTDGSATANVWGGQVPYTFLWDDVSAQTTQTANNLSAGIYHCLVTDALLNQITLTVAIGDNGGPSIAWESNGGATCGQNDGYVNVSVDGGVGSFTYLWSNGATTEDLVGVPPGEYQLLVTKDGPPVCKSVYNAYIWVNEFPSVQPICMVTVDSATNHNLVVWENVQNTGVDHYNIRRQDCNGQFTLIGSVDANAITVFEDISSLPFSKSDAYTLTAVDACAYESMQSNTHKTIHLEINLNEAAGEAQLIWDDYIGFPNPVFKIYKKTIAEGWYLYTTVPNTNHSYLDVAYNNNTISYAIQVEHPDGGCDAWNGNNKASGGPYYQASSNLEDEGITDHTKVDVLESESGLSVFPNPTNRVLHIENTELINSIKLFDISGKLIVSYPFLNQNKIRLNTQNFEPGVYVLEVQSLELTKTRIVIE